MFPLLTSPEGTDLLGTLRPGQTSPFGSEFHQDMATFIQNPLEQVALYWEPLIPITQIEKTSRAKGYKLQATKT